MSSTNDPFSPALHSLRQTLTTLPTHLSSLIRILSTARNAHTPEAQAATTDLTNALDDADADLSDLLASVAAAERDPTRFGLSPAEVKGRRDAVTVLGGEMRELRSKSERVLASTGGTGGGGGLPSPGAFEDEHDDDEDPDAYAAYEAQQQEQELREQDEALEGVYGTIGTLRQQADEMGRELEGQAGLLEEVDTVAERVGGKLRSGVKRVEWVIRKNEDAGSSCCIGVLIVVLIVLLLLALLL